MVTTRSGRQSGRFENQQSRLREYIQQRIQSHLNDNNNYEYTPEPTRSSHINHPHVHPGHYRDADEEHRHRFQDNQPKTERVVSYRRRRALF